jgi:hypothetical protein
MCGGLEVAVGIEDQLFLDVWAVECCCCGHPCGDCFVRSGV